MAELPVNGFLTPLECLSGIKILQNYWGPVCPCSQQLEILNHKRGWQWVGNLHTVTKHCLDFLLANSGQYAIDFYKKLLNLIMKG